MHANEILLRRLFDALDRHDHAAMAACYQPDATFRDIAFDLRGRLTDPRHVAHDLRNRHQSHVRRGAGR